MKQEEIGIAIIDVYDDDSLIECYKSINENIVGKKYQSYCITNRKKPLKDFSYDEKITHNVSFATLRNKCVQHFRNIGVKYIFLINSNVIIKNPSFFENTVETANFYGTWFLTGYGEHPTIINDTDSEKCILNVNTKLNTDLIFVRSGVVGTIGFFDQRYIDTKNLDVLDYINKLRKNLMYPPHPFHVTVEKTEYTISKIDKIDHSDILSKEHPMVGFSFGYFKHLHGYIPDLQEIQTASKEQLIESLGKIQENFSIRQKHE
jgi:hypothetical protein